MKAPQQAVVVGAVMGLLIGVIVSAFTGQWWVVAVGLVLGAVAGLAARWQVTGRPRA